MKNKNSDFAIIVLLFIPVIIAISRLFTNFSLLELIYLSLVVLIFLRYFIKIKVRKCS